MSPTRPPCFIEISKMYGIFDISLPRGKGANENREVSGQILDSSRGLGMTVESVGLGWMNVTV